MPKDVAFEGRGLEGCDDLEALCLISTCALTGLCFSECSSLQQKLEEVEGWGVVKAYGACE